MKRETISLESWENIPFLALFFPNWRALLIFWYTLVEICVLSPGVWHFICWCPKHCSCELTDVSRHHTYWKKNKHATIKTAHSLFLRLSLLTCSLSYTHTNGWVHLDTNSHTNILNLQQFIPSGHPHFSSVTWRAESIFYFLFFLHWIDNNIKHKQ